MGDEAADDDAAIAVRNRRGFVDRNIRCLETCNVLEILVLLPDCTEATQVEYQCIDGTARGMLQYTAETGTLTFDPSTLEHTILIPIVNERSLEKSSTFRVVLTCKTVFLDRPACTVHIVDKYSARLLGRIRDLQRNLFYLFLSLFASFFCIFGPVRLVQCLSCVCALAMNAGWVLVRWLFMCWVCDNSMSLAPLIMC